jgi:membrane-bound lytic murein transglycosylase MltF
VESSDAAHDQDEEAAAPPQSPAPASSDADFDTEIAESLDGLCSALMISAQDNDLPVPFFANLIWQESRLRQDAVSPVGALGIAQFMPRVAIAEGVGDPFDPRQAIPASARLLHALRAHFGNLGFVAAAYNAGARRVSEWLDHHRALPRETRTYVVRVTGRTVEAWRKSPLNDSKLTFVRRLPCRGLPAFAYFEQARLREAQQQNAAAKVTQKTGMKAPAARHLVVERKEEAGKVAHSAATGIMARNFHGRHDAAPRLRVAHEKRRVAQAASSRRES